MFEVRGAISLRVCLSAKMSRGRNLTPCYQNRCGTFILYMGPD